VCIIASQMRLNTQFDVMDHICSTSLAVMRSGETGRDTLRGMISIGKVCSPILNRGRNRIGWDWDRSRGILAKLHRPIKHTAEQPWSVVLTTLTLSSQENKDKLAQMASDF
jgi:hypothetical protein